MGFISGFKGLNRTKLLSVFCTCPMSGGQAPQWNFIRHSKGYYQHDSLSSSRPTLFNCSEMRHMTERWQIVGRIVAPVLIIQGGREHTV